MSDQKSGNQHTDAEFDYNPDAIPGLHKVLFVIVSNISGLIPSLLSLLDLPSEFI